MEDSDHFTRLELMYNSAPINKLLHCSVKIQKESSIVTIDVNPDLYHAANAVHGSLYFKSLDDSAFFAVNSIETEVFVLTTQFNIYLTRPISTGFIRAEGKLVSQTKSQFIAESIAYDSEGREIGRGSGLFVKSKIRLDSIPAYSKKLF